MFKSATLKLTSWYLAILIAISLLFSVVIYSIASNEVGARINDVQNSPRFSYVVNHTMLDNFRDVQVRQANASLITSLVVTNICIWIAGGIGSYYLARRTLTPIEEAHEAQSRFTSDASHELRTPLASMKTEIEVALRDPALKKEEMRELLESNLEEVNKLTNLSHMLLQLSRLDHDNIEQGKVILPMAIQPIVERLSKKDGNRIEFTSGKSRPVIASSTHVDELLTILLDNALKYSPEGSKVIVTLLNQKDTAGFSVSNEGEGIPANILPHIFDRFYRADQSRTSGEKKGYGLGLALAKKIVELNKGELAVSSAPEQVTTFRVLLPIFSSDKAKNQK
ncbi:MAG TPA: ATP-binding protein [Candidatus Chromulinivoraceae bacterium]|nr:ATP-binding protein [Candidatus Chromulinivoraceae bacterium]